MKEIMDSAQEAVKQILAKSVTAVGSVLLSDKGMDAMLALVAPSAGAASAMPLKLLSLMAAYAIWTQAVVPVVEEMWKKLLPPKPGTAAASAKSRWNLM